MQEAWWLSGLVTGMSRVWNQVDTLGPFGKALILITKSLDEDLKLLVPWLLTNKHIHMLS